ncbi:MAG: apolipoprotein N-acyltransferase [Asticcacaulis sp.]
MTEVPVADLRNNAVRYLTGHPRLTRTLDLLRGLRRRPRLMAALSGALIGFAQPPFGFLPGLFGYALLLWVLEGERSGHLGAKPKRTAFLIGWLAAFVYYLISCFWVAEAFLVDAATYGWMAPFAVTLLPAGLGLFWGAMCVLYLWLRPRGPRRFLLFAALFSVFEILRGTILSGFPWDLSGATWKAGGAMSQTASLIGVYGLGFVTVSAFCTPAVIERGKGWKGWWPAIVAACVLSLAFIWGEVRLMTAQVTNTAILVRLVQPGIGQEAKWTRGAFSTLFDAYVSLSRAARKDGGRPPDVIIWPEGALPATAEDVFAADAWTAPVLSHMLRDNQSLIMGTARRDLDHSGHEVWRNSMMVMTGHDNHTEIVGFYDKFKLVPFGEFTPFASLLDPLGIKALTHFDDSFTPGARTKPVKFGSLPPMLPLICYEGIFPSLDTTQYSSRHDRGRPQWIVNISNDAWFGPTSGPLQHLNLASYRSIEEGLPMVRSTPTGISVLVDPLGRANLRSQIGLNQKGFIDVLLPRPLPPTVYAGLRFGFQVIIALILLFSVNLATLARVSKKT